MQLAKYQAQLALITDAGKLLSDILDGLNAIAEVSSVSFTEETAFEMAADYAEGQGEDAFQDFVADNAPNSYFDAWNQDLENLVSTIPGLKTAIMTSYPALSAVLPQLDAITNAYNEIGPVISAFFVALTPEQSTLIAFNNAFGTYSSAEDAFNFYVGNFCGGSPPNPPLPIPGPGSTIPVTGVNSLDPNVKIGPIGVGSSMYISGDSRLGYSIYFDNLAAATAPAQGVIVTDTLDPNLNPSTLTLGPITFPNQVVSPPSIPLSVSPFTTTVDLRPTTNLLVQVTASLNSSTATLIETFQSLDPTTNQPPTDPTAGFLPPGAEGSAFFTVLPKSTVTTGTVVQNTATVVFDANAPINTPTWTNTVDNTPPVSHVSALPAQTGSILTVQWSGTDVGSGIGNFTIYVSDNGGAFVPWLSQTTVTSSTYNGQVGHTYGFYSIAQDLVGNIEPAKTSAEATTQVTQASPIPSGEISVTASGLAYSRVSQTFNGTVTIQNVSGNTIYGPFEVVFTALTGNVTVASATGTFNETSYLTVPAVGSLAPGQSATVSVQFKNPSNSIINFTPVVYSGSLN